MFLQTLECKGLSVDMSYNQNLKSWIWLWWKTWNESNYGSNRKDTAFNIKIFVLIMFLTWFPGFCNCLEFWFSTHHCRLLFWNEFWVLYSVICFHSFTQPPQERQIKPSFLLFLFYVWILTFQSLAELICLDRSLTRVSWTLVRCVTCELDDLQISKSISVPKFLNSADCVDDRLVCFFHPFSRPQIHVAKIVWLVLLLP